MIESVNFSLGQVWSLSARGSAVKLSDQATKELNAKLNPDPPPPQSDVVADNDPSKKYATLEKDGKTIATLYKSGLIETPNGVQLPSNLAMDGHGTSLADTRLKQMMGMYGGTASYTQDAKMNAASKTASTLFSAQLAGQLTTQS